jgi:phosphotriesterase-related protein
MSDNHEGNRFSRREAMGLLGIGAGAGLASLLGRNGMSVDAAQTTARGAVAAQTVKPITFPKGAVIRAITRDIDPATLNGSVLFHEHLSIRLNNAASHYTDDVAMMVEEARRALTEDSLACIVDGGHDDMGRNLDALRRIMTESGLPVVASGGYYMQRSYPADLAGKTADQLAEELAKNATSQRLGAFGEIGQQGGELTADERKVFEAVGKAAVRTGLPIFTHNAYSGLRAANPPVPMDAGLRQLDILEKAGAKADHIAIGHVCCLNDPKAEISQQIAKRGAFVGFDRVTLMTMPDPDRVIMIMALVSAGFADNLLLSSDFYSAAALKGRGGMGLNQTATKFGPMLTAAGMPEATLRKILNDNPRRFLAVVPKG